MTALPTVPNARLTDTFGWRDWRGYSHAGIDVAGITPGTKPPIYSVESGTVEFVGDNLVTGRNGTHIGVRTRGGGLWFYGHVSAVKVRKGQWVNEGDHIATMDHTGLPASAGIHLHLELWWGKDRHSIVDPLPYLAKGGVHFAGTAFGSRLLAKPTLAPVASITPIVAKPAPAPKEDTLSAAEVNEIKAHIDAKVAAVPHAVWTYTDLKLGTSHHTSRLLANAAAYAGSSYRLDQQSADKLQAIADKPNASVAELRASIREALNGATLTVGKDI